MNEKKKKEYFVVENGQGVTRVLVDISSGITWKQSCSLLEANSFKLGMCLSISVSNCMMYS